MDVSPKLKVVAPHYANAKETFIRLDEEVNKLMSSSDNSAISAQEVCIKNILQALLVQIPAVSHDIRNLAIRRRSAVDTMERQDALQQALANIERLRKAQKQPTAPKPVIAPKPEATVKEKLTVDEPAKKPAEKTTPISEKTKAIRKKKPAKDTAKKPTEVKD